MTEITPERWHELDSLACGVPPLPKHDIEADTQKVWEEVKKVQAGKRTPPDCSIVKGLIWLTLGRHYPDNHAESIRENINCLWIIDECTSPETKQETNKYLHPDVIDAADRFTGER